jgi:hypothetical protein
VVGATVLEIETVEGRWVDPTVIGEEEDTTLGDMLGAVGATVTDLGKFVTGAKVTGEVVAGEAAAGDAVTGATVLGETVGPTVVGETTTGDEVIGEFVGACVTPTYSQQ